MSPALVVVFGPTGSGKTSFINTVTGSNLPVGHSLESCTREVTTEGIPTVTIDGIQVQLIDTPGFDDSHGSDADILKSISHFLTTSFHQGQLVTGLIYMHRITDPRLGGSGKRNLRLFRGLCGQDSLQNVIFLTSMWGVLDSKQETSNERELLAHPLVSDFGCKSSRLVDRSPQEGRQIVRRCIFGSPQVLAIQKEMAEGARLEHTTAYEELDESLAAQKRQYAQELEELRRASYVLREQSDTYNRRRVAAEMEQARLLAQYIQAQEANQRAEEQRIAIEHRRMEIEREMMHTQRKSGGIGSFFKMLACGMAVGLML